VVATAKCLCDKYNFTRELKSLNSGVLGLQAVIGKTIDVSQTGTLLAVYTVKGRRRGDRGETAPKATLPAAGSRKSSRGSSWMVAKPHAPAKQAVGRRLGNAAPGHV
jgi:hypothetical protein